MKRLLLVLALLLAALPARAADVACSTYNLFNCGTSAGTATVSGANAFVGANSFLDGANFQLKNTATPTKILQFDLSGLVGTRTATVPNLATIALCAAGADCAFSANQTTSAVTTSTGSYYRFSDGAAAVGYLHNATSMVPHSMAISGGTLSNALHLYITSQDGTNLGNGKCGASICSDMGLVIHSHNATTTQWLHFDHNAVDGTVSTGLGGIDWTGVIGAWKLNRTVTAGGTTGAQTINKISGTVNFAAAATSLVVTNSLVSTTSIVFTTIRTADTTCTFVKSVVPASGSFTITVNAGCTAETSVGFRVDN